MSSTNNQRDAEESWDTLAVSAFSNLSDSEWLDFHGWPGHSESFATLVRSYFDTHPDHPTVRQCINLACNQRDKEQQLGRLNELLAQCWHCGNYFDKCQCGTTSPSTPPDET